MPEKKYIDSSPLIRDLSAMKSAYDGISLDGMIKALQEAPAADVVEVVRCKDCKYLYCLDAVDRRFYCRHFPKGLQGINIVEDNPFCSYGERKTEGG